MKFFTRSVAIMLFISMFIGIQAKAQEESKWASGNSFNLGFPMGDMESLYDMGYGIYANFDYNFSSFLAARFDVGWNSFSGTDVTQDLGLKSASAYEAPVVAMDNLNIWEFTGGLRAKIAVFYVEARGGYFTGINEWGVVPAVGLRFGRLDIQGSYTVAGKYQWAGARVGFYYWGGK